MNNVDQKQRDKRFYMITLALFLPLAAVLKVYFFEIVLMDEKMNNLLAILIGTALVAGFYAVLFWFLCTKKVRISEEIRTTIYFLTGKIISIFLKESEMLVPRVQQRCPIFQHAPALQPFLWTLELHARIDAMIETRPATNSTFDNIITPLYLIIFIIVYYFLTYA